MRLQIPCTLVGLAGHKPAEGCGMAVQSRPDYSRLFLPLPPWQMEVSHREWPLPAQREVGGILPGNPSCWKTSPSPTHRDAHPAYLAESARSQPPPQRVLGLPNFLDPSLSLVQLVCGIGGISFAALPRALQRGVEAMPGRPYQWHTECLARGSSALDCCCFQ